MLIVPRLIVLAVFAVFLTACLYVGYINEQLKEAISDAHHATLMIGFIIGAAAASNHLSVLAMKCYRRGARERRR